MPCVGGLVDDSCGNKINVVEATDRMSDEIPFVQQNTSLI